MKIVREIPPPSGRRRAMFRIPIHLYRAGFGRLFGDRILLLHHTGRNTGKPREAVLEVVQHDRHAGTYTVASGWGPLAAWYRNLLATPDATIEVGGEHIAVAAVALSPEEGAAVFADYAVRHRITATYLLPRLLGFSVDGSVADFREVGHRLRFVRFVPRIAA